MVVQSAVAKEILPKKSERKSREVEIFHPRIFMKISFLKSNSTYLLIFLKKKEDSCFFSHPLCRIGWPTPGPSIRTNKVRCHFFLYTPQQHNGISNVAVSLTYMPTLFPSLTTLTNNLYGVSCPLIPLVVA
jgi:hypothetical protein